MTPPVFAASLSGPHFLVGLDFALGAAATIPDDTCSTPVRSNPPPSIGTPVL